MDTASAHRPGNFRPEDAPSVVEPFDVGSTTGGREEDLEDDLEDEPEDEPEDETEDEVENEPHAARPPQAWPAGRRAGSRGVARRPRDPAAGRARPKMKKAEVKWAVDNVYRKLYKVDAAQAGAPVRPGHYKWWVSERIREGRDESKRIVCEGGPRRISFKIRGPWTTGDIKRWIAEKIVFERGDGPPPRTPEDRAPWYLKDSKPMAVYDHAVAWCLVM